jgi:hypothetical protein
MQFILEGDNEIENYKICTICNRNFPKTEEYFYKNKTNSKDGLSPWCKECAIAKQQKRQNDNPERLKKYTKQRYINKKDNYFIPMAAEYRDKHRENYKIWSKQWRKENPNKCREYQEERKQHKEHKITNEEWKQCKQYFNYSCAYCGMSEEEHKKKFNQQLHKEHAINDGGNGIENCVPSCKSCNGIKHKLDWNIWLNEENINYTIERYNKILEWLERFKTQ